MQGAPGLRGRPRDARLDARILDATLAHLATHGFDGMSMEHIAAEAGVPKPTLYRRWKNKADLATAALARLQAQEAPLSGDSTRAELVGILRGFRQNLLRPYGMATIGALLVEEMRHPELMALFRRRIVSPRRRRLREALRRGVERGEVRPDADLEVAVNFLVGSFYARHLTGKRIGAVWPRRIVAVLWDGISTEQGHRT